MRLPQLRLSRSSALIALLCAAPNAQAQDSVSKLNGLPGDAIDSHATGEQINDYVVDLDAFRSSWGRTFAVGPIAKASQQRNTAPLFYTSLVNAQALSRRLATNVPFLRGQYAVWNQTGFGVNNNPSRNDVPGTVSTVGLTGFQLGFAFADFGDGDPSGTALNSVTGGVASFTASRPSRLYVSRVVAATNSPSDACSLAALGIGSVDESGNVHFRADAFGSSGPCAGLNALGYTGPGANNLFRVDVSVRSPALNVISDDFPLSADASATTRLLANSATVHNVPNIVPRSLAGRPILIGTNFARQYVFEQVVGSLVGSAPSFHLGGLADHRGAMGYTGHAFPQLFPGGVHGVGGIIAGNSSIRDSVGIWGIASDGTPLAPIFRTLPAPAAGLDPDQPSWAPTMTQEFDHYHSQTAFQGSSQIALGRDQSGRLLVAGVVYYGFTPPSTAPYTNPKNYLAVARIDPLTGTTTWRAAAWTDAGTGKSIYQNGTTVIGNLRPFSSGFGPCMSAPMIDSVGNVWFTGSFQLASAPGAVRVGLFRSVLQGGNAYRLELVLAEDDVFTGPNSTLNYQVDFIPLTDSDSISSGAAWSNNISEVAHQAQSTTGLGTSDERTLGGVVVSASIVYDNNADGQYVKSTGTGGTPGSPDEDYNVLLYVAASTDCNGNGIADDLEIGEGTAADANANGVPDSCEGILYCFGDGSGTACPCANHSPSAAQAGCLSSLGIGGIVRATGSTSLSNDTAVLLGSQMPNSSALYFQGTSRQNGGLGNTFGDGLRCAGGQTIRLSTKFNTAGASQYPTGSDLPISVRGLVSSPGTRTYQVWYRNAAAFCTASTFNLTNGLELTWIP